MSSNNFSCGVTELAKWKVVFSTVSEKPILKFKVRIGNEAERNREGRMRQTYYGIEDALRALEQVLPLAEAYMAKAKSHPDWDKIQDARHILKELRESYEMRTR